MHHVAEGKGIPPFFLVVADNREQKLQQAAAFQKSLQTADVRCEFVEAPEHNHGSLNRAIGEPNDKVTQAMERFHDSVRGLKGSPAAPDDKDDFSCANAQSISGSAGVHRRATQNASEECDGSKLRIQPLCRLVLASYRPKRKVL